MSGRTGERFARERRGLAGYDTDEVDDFFDWLESGQGYASDVESIAFSSRRLGSAYEIAADDAALAAQVDRLRALGRTSPPAPPASSTSLGGGEDPAVGDAPITGEAVTARAARRAHRAAPWPRPVSSGPGRRDPPREVRRSGY